MVCLQEVKTCAFKTEENLQKFQKTDVVSHSQKKTLRDKISSMAEKRLPERVERAILRVDLDKMMLSGIE